MEVDITIMVIHIEDKQLIAEIKYNDVTLYINDPLVSDAHNYKKYNDRIAYYNIFNRLYTKKELNSDEYNVICELMSNLHKTKLADIAKKIYSLLI